MTSKFFKILLFNGVLLSLASVNALETSTDLYSRFYNISDFGGVTGQQVNTVYQDEDGFIWVGTDNGLFRYDGHDFFAYRHIKEDTLSISSSIINTIAGDKQGGIWVGTDNGLNYYDRERERFVRFFYNPSDPGSIRNNHIRKLFPEREGLILVETLDGTMTIFDREGEKTRHFSHDPISQPYYRYHALYQDEKGYVWFGGRTLGLHRLDPETGVTVGFPADPGRSDRKRENDISLVHVGSDGQWYVAGLDGFYRFFPERGDFERVFGTTSYYAVNDQEGNVWIGTGNGLARYNNENGSLRFYRYNQDIPWSLANNRVNAVLADNDGNIWAGTDNGLSFLSYRNRRFSNYTRITGESGSLSSVNVTSVIEDKNDNLWIGTRDEGLNLWDEETGFFNRFNSAQGDLAADNVSVLYEDSRGDIWIGLWAGAGFNKYNPFTGRFSHYAIDPHSMARDWYNDFYEDPAGEFWLGVWGARGLMGFDRETGRLIADSYTAAHIPNRFVINSAIVFDDYIFLTDRNGRRISRYDINGKGFISAISNDVFPPANQQDLLLPVLPGDIGRIISLEKAGSDNFIAAYDNHLIKFTKGFDVLSRVDTDTVISLFVSESNNKTYVLHPSGISVYDREMKRVGGHDLPVNFYQGAEIVADADGNIYFHQMGQVYRILASDGIFVQMDLPDRNPKTLVAWSEEILVISGNMIFRVDGSKLFSLTRQQRGDLHLPATGIRSVTRGSPNELLILYEDGTVFNVNTESGAVSAVRMPHLDNEVLSYLSFAERVNDFALLLVSGSDIFIVDTAAGEMELINGPDSRSLTSHLVTAIAGEADGTMWVGTSDGGLNRVSPRRDSIFHYLPGRNNNLAGIAVTCLYFDTDSNLWVGTRTGISVINRESGIMSRVGYEWGINSIVSIIQDDSGIMWIGTGRGLVRYCPVSGDWQLFTESDGIPSDVFNRAVVKRRNGQLVFGTRGGMTIIDPDRFTTEHFPVRVSISSFEVLGKRVKSHFGKHDTVYIDHTSNYITIGYSTMSYHHPPFTRFYYRMEGLSDTWMESTGNTADFTSLSPGTYTFQASRSNSYDIDNSTLTVIVKPPFYQTFWFRFVSFLFISGGLGAILLTYIHQLKLKHKSARFEQRLLLSQMNPHFVFNSLSAIQSFIYTNDVSEASDYLSDFSRLMRLILENSRSEEVALSREIQALRLYLRLQKLRFFDKFEYEIITDPAIVMQRVMIPPMLIQPFIENSIEHGIMHKREKGFLTLEINLCDGHLEAIVTDDGVGIARSGEINAGRNNDHRSMATAITNERLHNLYKRGRKNAGIKISDRLGTDGAEGTRVVLKIPYRLKRRGKESDISDIIFREDQPNIKIL